MMRYDVESELNPAYAITGSIWDYYTIYHIVEIHKDGTRQRIKSLPNYDDSPEVRRQTYRLVSKLTAKAIRQRREGGDGSA